MTTNNYFYFFSTSAQTLAGLMVFLGVFVVFRLQSLDNLLRDLHREIDEETTNRIHIHFYGGLRLIEIVENILKDYENKADYKQAVELIKGLVKHYKNIQRMKKSIVADFFGPCIAMAMAIILSFVGIALVSDKNLHVAEVFYAVCFLIPFTIIWSFIFMRGALRSESST
jgi:hypothetical protein